MRESFHLTCNETRKTRELAIYLAGMAKGSGDTTLKEASDKLFKLEHEICAGGYIGCSGGEKCTSDHK